MRSLNVLLMDELKNGCERLSDSSRASVAAYLSSRESDSGGFMDKAGNVDVYYTFFGLASAFALGTDINKKHRRFINGIDTSNLDLPDFTAYHGSLTLLAASSLPKNFRSISAVAAKGLSVVAKKHPIEERFPVTGESSPYSVFLSLMGSVGLVNEQVVMLWAQKYINAFHVASGGWSNIKGNTEPSLNATAAAITVLNCANIPVAGTDLKWIKDQQLQSGGFISARGVPMPDLLSTATALVALKLSGEKPLFPVMDFIQSHWRDDGGFAATFNDEDTDCEYTFYGLLALGASID